MMQLNLTPLILSFYVSGITTCILLLISMPVSWWLSRNNNFVKRLIEILIFLPLVLPPTILGFYLLLIFNSNSIIGKSWVYMFNSTLMFSFSGLVLSSMIYSLPFAIQPIQNAFKKINQEVIDQAFLLQYSKIKIFVKIILPLSKNGIITSMILTFMHTLGEFGVVLMIGGNIPGKTQVISIAIYESVEMLNYSLTHQLSFIVVVISFLILAVSLNINKNED
jgi:molybdate transport system permease protein